MADQHTDGGPAFPSEGEGHGNPQYHSPGMTLRDYFAGQALVGLLANTDCTRGAGHLEIPTRAYQVADVMLAARDGRH